MAIAVVGHEDKSAVGVTKALVYAQLKPNLVDAQVQTPVAALQVPPEQKLVASP